MSTPTRSNVIAFPEVVGHTIKANPSDGFLYCATCEYPVCQKCKAHPEFIDDKEGARYECDRHGFVCWNNES